VAVVGPSQAGQKAANLIRLHIKERAAEHLAKRAIEHRNYKIRKKAAALLFETAGREGVRQWERELILMRTAGNCEKRLEHLLNIKIADAKEVLPLLKELRERKPDCGSRPEMCYKCMEEEWDRIITQWDTQAADAGAQVKTGTMEAGGEETVPGKEKEEKKTVKDSSRTSKKSAKRKTSSSKRSKRKKRR